MDTYDNHFNELETKLKILTQVSELTYKHEKFKVVKSLNSGT